MSNDTPKNLLHTVLERKFNTEDSVQQTEQLNTVFLPDRAKIAHEVNSSTADNVKGLITLANDSAMTDKQSELLNGLAEFLAESAKEITKRLMK